MSISKRKLVNGVGINDANYMVMMIADGKAVRCPVYARWVNMLSRCYCERFHEHHPTYKDCTVCDEWLVFSVFADWVNSRESHGLDLDKDVKVKGNKVYGPEVCMFVPHPINVLLLSRKESRGKFPVGVYRAGERHNFSAYVYIDGNKAHLGSFTTKESASEAHKKAKNAEIKRKCEQYPQFAKYLINHLL
ncbi:AP2 domain-containing protein [bacterium]|nr:AP2 domain-containing protein [bacterium]